jgi:hypothetical protein
MERCFMSIVRLEDGKGVIEESDDSAVDERRIEEIWDVRHGTDGVLFVRNSKWEPFHIGTPTGEEGMLRKALLGSPRGC